MINAKIKLFINYGFTIIELIVVIAIIGILSSVVLASLNSARKKGRDARRIADIKQLQLALELYYDAEGKYPATTTAALLVDTGYIAAIPTDPSNQASYPYSAYYTTSGTASVCTAYHLGADLETSGHTALNSDADVTATPSGYETPCTGSITDFSGLDSGKCNAADSGVACYDLKS